VTTVAAAEKTIAAEVIVKYDTDMTPRQRFWNASWLWMTCTSGFSDMASPDRQTL
jgi:hypothetical protein